GEVSATTLPLHSTAGRRLARASVVLSLVLLAPLIYFSWSGFHRGDTTSTTLLVCVAGLAVLHYAHCRGLLMQGHTEAEVVKGARLGRVIVTLPIWLAVAYWGPLLERLGKATVFWFPTVVFHVLHRLLPEWLAITGAVIATPIELVVASVICTVIVLEPMRALLGPEHPAVETVEQYLPNFKYG
ncbi:MAG: hypothetical protein ACXVQQ_03325, partial [Gaiellaceae bacterium]